MLRKLNLLFSVTLLLAVLVLNGCKKVTDDIQPESERVTPMPTAIGKPVGSPIMKEIGSTGGSITSPDGRITLAIPAGALSGNTPITIQPIENTTPLGIGLSYDLLPNGQQFAKPVIETLNYTDEEMGGTAPELVEFGLQNDQNVWKGTDKLTVNKTAHTMSASVSLLRRCSFYATFKMLPGVQTMFVNETALLQIVKLPYSEDPDSNKVMDNFLHALGQTKLVPVDKISNWLVNGQPNTTGSNNGWVTGDAANEKHYHAPADIPARNPVMVSADINTGKGTISVVSNMTIQKETSFEFSCNGQSYKNLEGNVTASTSAGTFYLFMMSKEVTGDKVPGLVLAMGEGFKGKGSYAFGEKNQVTCTVTSDPYEWWTEYYEENKATPKYGTGTVTIERWGNVGELVTGTISGTLHWQKKVLDITDHRTAAVNAKFSYYRSN